MRVGIPRALLYHYYGNGWTAFLESTGVEPLVSASTTGNTVALGAGCADNETCLPVKVFTGHLLMLRDEVDAILVPRVTSQSVRTTSCPKYLGLPDMARASDSDLPPVLTPVMDLGDRRSRWTSDWHSLARRLGASESGARTAVERMMQQMSKEGARPEIPTAGRLRVGVAGHHYNVHDDRVSLGLLNRIRAMGAEPVTVEQVSRRQAAREVRFLARRIRWEFESRLAGAVLHWSRTASVEGVVYVNSFACGPGSMIGALIEDQLRHEGSMPLMSITLDEHSSETGLVTRIEAFLDMLKRARTLSGGAQGRGGSA